MFRLSQGTGYAIQALTVLASAGCASGSVKGLASASGVPTAYLAKLFKKLSVAGILTTSRGRAGGTMLAHAAEEISLWSVAEAIEGADWVERCMLGLEECSDRRACPMHQFWKAERKMIHRNLEAVSLADIVAFERRKEIHLDKSRKKKS